MEDYIFLIVAIVLSIFGAINQNKKKKAEVNPFVEGADEPRHGFMDQLFDRDFLDEPVVKKAPKVQVNPTQANIAAKSTSEIPRSKFYHQTFKSTLPDRPKHDVIQTSRKLKEEEVVVEEDESVNYLEDFSLRKAFIYSEILNRKY
jgi:hypothetical protein